MKPFYTGPVVNTETLVVMLEKHGIRATQEFADPTAPDDGDFRAYQLFYAQREGEL